MTVSAEFERALRLHQEGKLREAFLRYDAIIQADPTHAAALHFSGVVLHQAGKHAEAIARIRASIGIDPGSADAWSNLALALEAVDRREAAINALKEAARLAPKSPEIWTNLAASELALGHDSDAEKAARSALAADGTHPGAWHNLALALEAQGRVLEALDAAGRAAGFVPDEPAFAGHKAQLEVAVGRNDAAHATLAAALARKPANAALRFELAGLLERRGDLAAAADAYEQTLRIDPDNGAALSQLVFLRQRLADWRDLEALRTRFRRGVTTGTQLLSPFALLSQPSTRAEQRRCAEQWTAAFTRPIAPVPPRLLSGAKLRLGYLSADFHAHATAFLTAGLFEHHDRSRFEVIGYSTGPDDGSPMRGRITRAFDRFVDASGLRAERLAEVIRRDGIDILIDLKGHTAGAPPGVLALRPGPIQVHYLGYPGTLGGGLVDYLIGDDVVTPIADAADYAETLALLPGCYQVNDRKRPIAEPPARSVLDLPTGSVVFCCFNNIYKLNPQVFDVWARILTAVPDSVLWLLARRDSDPTIANLRAEARKRGIDPARIVFASSRPNAEYLGLYRQADLFLDTWPYNAHTTASDALWAGCPILTMRGETFAGRVAASLLTAVGLPQLIADTEVAYEEKAVALARDSNERQRLRDFLAGPGRSSALFDTARTTATLEAAYMMMADQYRRRVREPFRIQPAS
ncbi:MAG TPA: tetratricopeptide repeat protein [Casimicrobiaceae bacterium]